MNFFLYSLIIQINYFFLTQMESILNIFCSDNDISFSANSENNIIKNATNKRIHIYFTHGGIFCMRNIGLKRDVETILANVWGHFGTVTDNYYHAEFSYGFVTFSTHEQAQAAIDGMTDSVRFRAILSTVRASLTDTKSKDLLDRLFVAHRSVLPSWASPRQ